ncbi:putative O-glycosylation ligase, exosortase A system-associated [Zoogloea sp.]|uniref:putative O-glycosylation ligase, exosortase A system-associated n=1 Tax=Zoogloea sp. TaxID=49181 RepID=UPI0035AE91D6
MRDLLVTLLFCYGGIKALRYPFIAALLWTWIGLMNPHRLGWGFAYNLPFAMISVGLLVISMMAHPKLVRWPSSGPVKVLVCFLAWMGITTLAAFHVPESATSYVNVLKVLGVTLLVGCVIRTREEILAFIAVTVLSVAFFGIKGGAFTLMTGGAYRVWGPPDSVIADNNELAIALVVSIPLLYYLILRAEELVKLPMMSRLSPKWIKRFLFVSIGLCAASVLGSHSRGAMLAMSSMAVVLWWRSKSKLTIGIVLLLLAPALIMFMPSEWGERMGTIKTYDSDASAMGRLNAWGMAINIANSRIVGAGFATDTPFVYHMFAPNANEVLVAHSIYFQVLGQHGYIGLALFLTFWILTYRTAGRLMKLGRGHPDLVWVTELGAMMKVSVIGFAVGGAFLNLAFWDMPYYLMIILVVTEKWAKGILGEQKAAAPGDAPGLKSGGPLATS